MALETAAIQPNSIVASVAYSRAGHRTRGGPGEVKNRKSKVKGQKSKGTDQIVTTLLIATTNPGKLREIVKLLDSLEIELKTLADFPNAPTAQESGSTFVENARQKALHYAALSGLPTVAEDSGFEVDALDGAPGIHSARYLGADVTYPERFEEIYRAVRQRGQEASAVRFVCALTLASANRILFETTGVVEGLLAQEPAGQEGFGYDPIFFYPPYSRTLGQVSTAEKSAISHRGKAFAALRDFLIQRRGRGALL